MLKKITDTYHTADLLHESAFEPSGKKVCQKICTICQHTDKIKTLLYQQFLSL